MHTFKVEIENSDVVEKVLWFLQSLKNSGVKVTKADDEFAIDVNHCLDVLEKSKKNPNENFEKISSSDLFEKLGI